MDREKYYINNYCHIRNGSICLNGEKVFDSTEDMPDNFIKAAYSHFSLEYPKFYKMDTLSKMAFIASEMILKDLEDKEDLALNFSNRASSLDTDRRHQKTIENRAEYFPSPAIFVYTLPNICIGEISIRHKLHSENSFFIFDAFNAGFLYNYSCILLKENKAKNILCAWVDIDGKSYDTFMYLIMKEGDVLHSIKEIERLYKLHD